MVELDVSEEDDSVGFRFGGSEILRISGTITPADRMRIAELVAELVALRARCASTSGNESNAELAGYIAHDTNNALAAILCAAEVLSRRADPDVAVIGSQIVEECTHAAELVRNLLPDPHARRRIEQCVDVNQAVCRFAPTLERIVARTAAFATDLAPNVGSASIGRIDLERVLVNLVTNARDARAKKVVVATAAVDEMRCPDGSVLAGRWVVVKVRDDGIGMDASTLRFASEPFFTTKPAPASGLGLASVARVLREAGGHLFFDTAPGAGTRADVWLPSV